MGTIVKDILNDHHADFVGLQETMRKKYSDNFFNLIDPRKDFSWHWLRCTSRSGAGESFVGLDLRGWMWLK